MINIPYLTSCNHCREKKRKCNGERPVCSLCRAHNVACEYRQSRRFRKRFQDQKKRPLQNIMPVPGNSNGEQQNPVSPSQQVVDGSSVFIPPAQNSTTPSQATTLPYEVSAFSKLLAGNMYPQTQQLPQPIIQGVNTFMSPFPDTQTQTLPKWLSQYKPEAAIISNLENIASANTALPMLPMQAATTSDGILFGNLASQFMPNSSNVFQQAVPQFPIDIQQQQGQQQQQQMLQNGVTGSSVGMLNVSSGPMTTALDILGPAIASPVCNASGNASPSVGPHLAAVSSHYSRSPSASVVSDSPAPAGTLYSINEQDRETSSQVPLSGDASESWKRKRQTTPKQKNGRRGPVHYPEDFIPEIIKTYAREFPGELSAGVLLKVMRGICSNTRTSLVNIDLELSWCMILKGIMPRMLLFAYIASMTRGQVIDQELMSQLPAKFDETCYELAVNDIQLALDSPSLWGALSLHLIGRYEFQSSRYDLMMEHYEMATEILTKTTFHGYPFPWINVPEKLKHTFEYDYYVYTYWVGFQWHLVCSFNLDRPFNVDIGVQSLPIPATIRGYFAPDLPCSFDLLTLLPANSWPRSAQTENLDKVWYCGFNDPEYEGWRPEEWNNISPNYKITVQLQRMLPLGAQLYKLQCDFCEKKMTLSTYLQQLHTQQELLKRWLYSLPEEFEITQDKVNQFTSAAVNHHHHKSSIEAFNRVMDFKELIMIYGLYSSFMIRANRVALLGMLNESLESPATSMHMRIFGLRDYFEAVDQGVGDIDYGSKEYDMWQKNLAFHKCRMQCYESMSILCDVVQLSFVLRLNLFTYGTTYVAIAGEMLNVLISQLGIRDKNVKWKTKTRLAHVLCLLRSLQHWAPAIYLFVYGIQLLSDPYLLLEKISTDDTKQTYSDDENNMATAASSNPLLTNSSAAVGGSGNPIEIPNPFQRNHIINLIVEELDMSLAMFLAPAYPMLLLKIFASSNK
ncbi:hypothetical protein EV175_000611 [Coemansia sp. RSA 1933]|nr:hypothetical protein EV175_000611 [Coemansia sp. RSA 1933]